MKKRGSLREQESLGQPDYKEYVLGVREIVVGVLLGLMADVVTDYLFFRSITAFFILLFLIPVSLVLLKGKRKFDRRKALRSQFRDAMQSLSSAIIAGYSVENAIEEAKDDMCVMYGESGIITKEFSRFLEGIRNSQTPEEMFGDLAVRSGVEEIEDFSEVFSIAKRSGGDLSSVIRLSVKTISEKIDTEGEIETVIASKRMEGRIMDAIPCLMILYIDFTSPGFFNTLYYTTIGKLIMIVCFVGYIGAIMLSEKLMKIEV